jgi:organic hydroperoxide reductase OsmC/OhrA
VNRQHHYQIELCWTGNDGAGTGGYRAYRRDHLIRAAGKNVIDGSSDAAFRGDAARWNPEELLVAALAACHQLQYLHLCSDAGIVVTRYADSAEGVMREEADGGGRFERVVLHPRVAIRPGGDLARANALHAEAHRLCFIARSVAFPVGCDPAVVFDSAEDDAGRVPLTDG